jgi:hypothetical protein
MYRLVQAELDIANLEYNLKKLSGRTSMVSEQKIRRLAYRKVTMRCCAFVNDVFLSYIYIIHLV